MKKLIWSIFFTVAFSLAVSSAYASEISGTYEGWYYANQGQTGLTLTINDDNTGVFEFYNLPGKNNAKDGSYKIKAAQNDDGSYTISGTEWIEQPSGYSYVTLNGELNGGEFSGKVDNNWDFMLYKNNNSYQQIADSTYANHRYEIFDESLTWQEAKFKCEEMGGHLVTVNSEEEQKYIEKLLENGTKKQYWIGMSRSDDGLQWITGEEIFYENWDSSEPNSHTRSDGEKENYIQIYNEPNPAVYSSRRFAWNDIYNDNAYPGEESFFSLENAGYICEWETWTEAAEWSTPELQKAADLGLIPDVLVGKDMTQTISRGEFAAVVVNLFEEMTGGRAVMSSECNFTDIVYDENRNYILKAYNIGAVKGMSDKEYSPSLPITREQLATMLCRVYKRSEWPEWTLETDDNYTINYSGVAKFADDEDISDYAKPSVYFMVKYGVLAGIGDNKFAPRNTNTEQEAIGYANATREQAIVMSLRSFENLQ